MTGKTGPEGVGVMVSDSFDAAEVRAAVLRIERRERGERRAQVRPESTDRREVVAEAPAFQVSRFVYGAGGMAVPA